MTILDVRTSEEYAAGHFEEAINFDVSLLLAGQLPAVDKEAPLIVYCRTGNRSETAKHILDKKGFSDVTDGGGLVDMQRAGYKPAKS